MVPTALCEVVTPDRKGEAVLRVRGVVFTGYYRECTAGLVAPSTP